MPIMPGDPCAIFVAHGQPCMHVSVTKSLIRTEYQIILKAYYLHGILFFRCIKLKLDRPLEPDHDAVAKSVNGGSSPQPPM